MHVQDCSSHVIDMCSLGILLHTQEMSKNVNILHTSSHCIPVLPMHAYTTPASLPCHFDLFTLSHFAHFVTLCILCHTAFQFYPCMHTPHLLLCLTILICFLQAWLTSGQHSFWENAWVMHKMVHQKEIVHVCMFIESKLVTCSPLIQVWKKGL